MKIDEILFYRLNPTCSDPNSRIILLVECRQLYLQSIHIYTVYIYTLQSNIYWLKLIVQVLHGHQPLLWGSPKPQWPVPRLEKTRKSYWFCPKMVGITPTNSHFIGENHVYIEFVGALFSDKSSQIWTSFGHWYWSNMYMTMLLEPIPPRYKLIPHWYWRRMFPLCVASCPLADRNTKCQTNFKI